MKKNILIVLIALLALGYYFFTRDKELKVPTDNEPQQTNDFRPDPSNSSYTFNDGTYTLSNGKAILESGEEILLLDDKEYGDINNDDKDDTVVLLVRMGGGSGVFIHVAAYVSGPVNYKGTNAVFLGDRIAPQGLSTNNGVVTVAYLDREADEAFSAEPTVLTTEEFVFTNGELQKR